MTALLVDDSSFARNILKSYLIEMAVRWNFFDVSDGTECLKFLDDSYGQDAVKRPIDLILLDLNMPRMLGLDCLKKIRADARFDKIKIIVVTSDGDRDSVVESIKRGASDYCVKPIDPVLFKAKVEKLLEIAV
jgi:two-component system chemotaxis response regulator CheY